MYGRQTIDVSLSYRCFSPFCPTREPELLSTAGQFYKAKQNNQDLVPVRHFAGETGHDISDSAPFTHFEKMPIVPWDMSI